MRNSVALSIFSMFIFLILFIGNAQATNTYSVSWFSSIPNGTVGTAFTPVDSITPGFHSVDVDSCNISIEAFGTLDTTISRNLIMSYYSPLTTLKASIARTISSNIVASSFGVSKANTPTTNNVYEAWSQLIWGGTAQFVTLKNTFTCGSASRYMLVDGSELDSEDDRANTYAASCSGAQGTPYQDCIRAFFRALNGTVNFNTGNITVVKKGNYTKITEEELNGATDLRHLYAEYYVFNSSAMGRANWSFIKAPSWTIFDGGLAERSIISRSYAAFLYKLNDQDQNVTLCAMANDPFPCTGELVLDVNEMYVIVFVYAATTNAYPIIYHKIETAWNVTIDIYTPEYLCGDWSACSDIGERTRTCVDQNNIAPDRIEFKICYTAPEEELWLGFNDETYDAQVWHCFQEWNCGFTVENVTRLFPLNWTIPSSLVPYTDWQGVTGQNITAYGFDYLKITDETQDADGDGLALKMWYIPPKQAMPVGSLTADTYSVACGNITSGGLPSPRRYINKTLFISKNVTFPAPDMNLFFNVKRCSSPEVQYAAPNIFGWEQCGPSACYTHSGNCSESPKATIWASLTDADTFESIWTHYSDVIDAASWEAREIVMDPLELDRNYTLSFAVKPLYSNLDTDSYCLYLDNVSFFVRDEALPCVSFCDGNTYGLYHQAVPIENACSFTEIQMHQTCVTEEIWDDIQDTESFCSPLCEDSDYQFFNYNNATESWEIIYNSDFCVGWCSDEETQDKITDVLTTEGVTEMFSFFLSPLFLSIIISLGVGGFVVAKTNQMVIGLITISMFLTGFTILGYFPLWALIVMVIISAFLMARGTLGVLGGK